MIAELFKFITSKASLAARKNGALYESVAFESRAKRLHEFWQSHWDAAQEAVTEFITKPELSRAKTLLVLASGSLFELPMPLLLERFDKIIFVDFVFPKSVRKIADLNKNKIELFQANLNNTQKILELTKSVDLILSCNVLSQLHLFEKDKNAELYQKRHIEILKNSGKPVLLWSDTVRNFAPKGKTQVIQKDPTAFVNLGSPWKKWQWFIAPAPELHKDYDISLKVEAYFIGINS